MHQFQQGLKDSEITKVLADGLALLYHHKPQFPVSYLANYLKSYNRKKTIESNLLQKLNSNNNIINVIKDREDQQAFKVSSQKAYQRHLAKQQSQYLNIIKSAQFHQEILNGFCHWVEKRKHFTGVYIGQLQNPTKKIDLDVQDGQYAHLDLEAPKVIKFKYTSKSHEFLLNKTLTQQSVIGKTIIQSQNIGDPAEGQQNLQKKQNTGQVYIPSVVGNSQLHFFKFPRLGSFYGVVMKIKTYLSQKCFDSNLIKIQNYKKAKNEWDKQQQEKQNKFREAYEEKVNSGIDQKELEQMEAAFQKQLTESISPKFEQFQYGIRTFIVCFDTLGQDVQISQKQRIDVKRYIESLRQSWQEKQMSLLKSDIQTQLKQIQGTQTPQQQVFNKLIEEQDKQLPTNEEVIKVKDNQKLYQMQMDALRLQKLKQYMSEDKYLAYLDTLLNMNVIKYQQIIQNLLYFLNYTKKQTNFENTNILNWRKSRQLLQQKNQFIQHIGNYNPRGSKPGITVLPYAKWQRVLKNLQKYQIAAVASYNIYLAFIFRFLQICGRLRKADRQQRINLYKINIQLRNQRIAEKQIKNKQKLEKLENAKSQALQKEENFDEVAWQLQYDQQNPPIDIGQQIPQEIDNDILQGIEIAKQQ